MEYNTNQNQLDGIDKDIADMESWGDALQRQQSERNAQNGVSTYGQMKELVGRRELAEIQNGQRAQDAIASALAIAQQNGGRLPRVVTDYLNRQFGFDGKTMGIMDGGIDEKGNFGFVFGERDQNGNTAYRKQMIPRTVQLGLMEGYPSLFSEDAVKAHRQKMMDEDGLASGEIDAYSNVARLSRERLASRIAELTPRDTKLETERLRQEGMNRRADQRQGQFDQKMEFMRQQLDEQIQKRLASAKNAEERNAILKEAKEAEIKLQQEEIERKYAQMGIQYGSGETRKNAQEKVKAKLDGKPQDTGDTFKELSRDEYTALSPEDKQKYRETWKNWKSKQAK